MARHYLQSDFFTREYNEGVWSRVPLVFETRLPLTKVSISSSRRNLSSIISSSEKVGLSAGMGGCELWKIDGEAGGDEDDDSEHNKLDDESDDSDNRICSSKNFAMMETKRTRKYYLSLVRPFGLSVFFLLRRHKHLNRKSEESEVNHKDFLRTDTLKFHNPGPGRNPCCEAERL